MHLHRFRQPRSSNICTSCIRLKMTNESIVACMYMYTGWETCTIPSNPSERRRLSIQPIVSRRQRESQQTTLTRIDKNAHRMKHQKHKALMPRPQNAIDKYSHHQRHRYPAGKPIITIHIPSKTPHRKLHIVATSTSLRNTTQALPLPTPHTFKLPNKRLLHLLVARPRLAHLLHA